jgi:GNAT superfamily N-acetyltransferase
MQHPPLDDGAIASLERATLDAVAPPAVHDALDGWLVPFDTSTIGRATSAVPTRHHDLPDDSVGTIAALFTARGLHGAYRVADVAGLAPLQEALRRHGYAPKQPTLVQVGTVAAMGALCPGMPLGQLSLQPVPAWSSVYLAEGFDPVDGAHRVQALSRSPHVVYAWVAGEEGQSIAAGTAAFSQGWASIHGMRTLPAHRGKGLAGRILATLADAARARGLERVFLQVEEGNTAALALYRRAGFTTAWRYHYWRK